MRKKIYDKGKIISKAVFDEDMEGNKYRFVLERTWNEDNEDKPMVSVIMLNPSFADGLRYDVSSMRIINYLIDKNEFGGIYILNLYPYIETNSKKLTVKKKSLNKEENNKIITKYTKKSRKVYFGWGIGAENPKNTNNSITRIQEIIDILMNEGIESAFYFVNENGEKIHPSRITIADEKEINLEELKRKIKES